MAGGELKDALGSGDDGGEHFQRCVRGLRDASLRGGVDDESKFAGRKGEGADVAGEEIDGGIGGEVGRFLGEAAGIAREDGETGVEAEEAVEMAKAFNKPGTEESGATGEEELAAADLVPEALGAGGDQVEVFGRQFHRSDPWLGRRRDVRR